MLFRSGRRFKPYTGSQKTHESIFAIVCFFIIKLMFETTTRSSILQGKSARRARRVKKTARCAVFSQSGERQRPDRRFKPYTGSHLCSTKKLQNIKSTRFSRSCAFLLLYLVVRVLRGIFEFRSCILTFCNLEIYLFFRLFCDNAFRHH